MRRSTRVGEIVGMNGHLYEKKEQEGYKRYAHDKKRGERKEGQEE